MDPVGQKLSCMAMSEVVESHPWQTCYLAYQAREFTSKTPRKFRLSILTTTHKGFGGLPDPKLQQCFGLLALQAAKFINDECRKCNHPSPIGFWRFKSGAGFGLF